MNKVIKLFSSMGTGWSKMSIGKKAYAILWLISGALLISLIVMFVALNTTFKESTPPAKGWTVTENGQVKATETMPESSQYKIFIKDPKYQYKIADPKDPKKQIVAPKPRTHIENYEDFDKAIKDLDYHLKYNDNIFLATGELPGKAIVGENYVEIVKTNSPLIIGTEYFSAGQRGTPNSISEKLSKKEVRKPIYAADKWKVSPSNDAKNATTATASVAFVWAVIFTGAIFTTVIVSKKSKKGGSK